MKKEKERVDLSEVIGDTLNIFGLKIDLAKLLSCPEETAGQLEELREKLKQAGGQEVLSDEEWRSGQTSLGRGLTGLETAAEGLARQRVAVGPGPRPAGRNDGPVEILEPPVDVFDEPGRVTIVAEVPGVGPDDLETTVEHNSLRIATRPMARRAYRKTLELSANVDPESLEWAWRNGVLKVELRKKAPNRQRPRQPLGLKD